MSLGTIVRNAGSHRILYALSFGVRTSKELKIIVGAINSVKRFDGEYMDRLATSGCVRRVHGGWMLTPHGRERLDALGPATGVPPPRSGKQQAVQGSPYVPEKHNPRSPTRPGSEDFLQYPSRMGAVLYYRDGRIERTDHGY